MPPLCEFCGAPNRTLVHWCQVCGHVIGEAPEGALPTADDLRPDERERWLDALGAERGLAVRVVGAYVVLGWAGVHRFVVGDEIGGILRLLAAVTAAIAAFGFNVNAPAHTLLPLLALGALWIADAPFIPGLLRDHRRSTERHFFVETWRARSGRRAAPPPA